MIAKIRISVSERWEKGPRWRNRHSAIQEVTPVNARPKSEYRAKSRWALITALEIPVTGGSVRAHIEALPVTKVGTPNMAQITNRTRLLRFMTTLSSTSAEM